MIGVPGIAFGAVFGLFVVAFLVLVVVTIRWAVRRDRQGRAQWLARRRAAAEEGLGTHGRAIPESAASNGHAPAAPRRGDGGRRPPPPGSARGPDDHGRAR
jgi:hypothetical protein